MKKFVSIMVVCLSVCSCSTTRVLSPGQYRLARNEVVVDDKNFSTSEISPYIRQQANTYFFLGWNPFLNIYNWSDGSDKPLSKFCRKIGTAPVVYNPSLISSSVENITNHLHHLGYYNAKVKALELPKDRKMKVKYEISLGNRLPVVAIKYDVPSGRGFGELFMADTLNTYIHRGAFLSEKLLEDESARSAEHLRNLGFYGFSKNNYFFHADTISRPGQAILHYSVKDYTRGADPNTAIPIERYRFGDVNISCDKSLRIKESVLRRLNAIVPGTFSNDFDVNKTYSRYSSLQIFSGVNISTKPTDDRHVDCDIKLIPAKVKGLKLNLEGSFTSTGLIGISPQLNFYHKNLFHGGEWFNIGFTGAFQFKPSEHTGADEYGVSASLSIPKTLLLPQSSLKGSSVPRTEFKASYNYQNRPEFVRHVVSASMGYNGRVNGKFLYQLYPVQLSFVHLNDISDSFKETLAKNPYLSYSYSDHFDAGVGGMLYLSSSTEMIPSVSYRYLRFNFDGSGNVLSLFKKFMPKKESGEAMIAGTPFSQYVRGELNLANTFRFGRKNGQALASRLVVGTAYAYGNSVSMPYEKQFFVGGASSMRGWQARSVGPGFSKLNQYTILPSQTGDVKLEADLEWRARLFWKLEAALFAEVGNVWTLPWKDRSGVIHVDDNSVFRFSDFYKSLAADWGMGLRVNLDFIVLRVDLGLKVRDPSKEESQRWLGPDKWFTRDGYAFHFGVGYPF